MSYIHWSIHQLTACRLLFFMLACVVYVCCVAFFPYAFLSAVWQKMLSSHSTFPISLFLFLFFVLFFLFHWTLFLTWLTFFADHHAFINSKGKSIIFIIRSHGCHWMEWHNVEMILNKDRTWKWLSEADNGDASGNLRSACCCQKRLIIWCLTKWRIKCIGKHPL